MLRVTDLAVARGGVTLLAGIGFEVVAGAVLVLRGPNGIGKTTLLRTIAGLQPPVAGEVAAAPETLAYAGHRDGVKATLTVAETLDFWARLYGRSVPDEVWEAFDLAGLRDRMGGTLSAGQTRRLGLARLAVIGRHLAGGGAALIATHTDLGIAAPELDLSAFRARPPVEAAYL